MCKLSGVYDFFNRTLFDDCQDVWVISDTHFGEDDLKQAFPNRPSDDELVKRINKMCGRASCLILLGDVSDLFYVRKLRAVKKILIQGNHDKSAETYQRECLYQIFDADIFSKEQAMAAAKEEYPDYEIVNIFKAHDVNSFPYEYWHITMDNKLFDEVFTGPLVLGEKLILSHEPINVPWAFNLHGHAHSGPKETETSLNVCADVCGYTPVNLNGLLKSGILSRVKSLHRTTIDRATERKKK